MKKAPMKKAATKKTKKAPAKAAARKAAPRKKVVTPIPAGYHAVTPYLCIDGAAAAIEFYKQAFGARERMRMAAPDGRIGHAEIVIGGAAIMLADEHPALEFLSPKKRGGPGVNIHLYMKGVDAVVQRAIALGARLLRPVQDQFYGDRTGSLEDPFGHVWHIATHIEDLSMAEMKRRGDAAKQSG